MIVNANRKSAALLGALVLCFFSAALAGLLLVPASLAKAEASVQGERFELAGHQAFILAPHEQADVDGGKPWVWYAPTLGNHLPGGAEQWMFDRLHAKGIAIAGIDVGESYGSPAGRAAFQKLYEELTENRGYSKKPVLLARSRGGLMLYNWAVEHPDAVGGIAGIYPVCNLTSYPGLAKAAPAYGMSPEELKANLAEHNPVDRIASLAKSKVPILHIHGDSDRVVPLSENSALLAKRYNEAGGEMKILVVEDGGHTGWRGWFESEALTDFMIAHSFRPGQSTTPPDADAD